MRIRRCQLQCPPLAGANRTPTPACGSLPTDTDTHWSVREGCGFGGRTTVDGPDYDDPRERLPGFGVVEGLSVRGLVASDIEAIQELPQAGRRAGEHRTDLEECVATLEARIEAVQSIDDRQFSKAAKFAAVLAYAENKATGQRSKVAVSASEVKGCAGVSRRYAYELLDAMAEEITGVRLREPQRVQTGSGTKRKQKALLVDCEAAHTDAWRVNQDTTPECGDEGENTPG